MISASVGPLNVHEARLPHAVYKRQVSKFWGKLHAYGGTELHVGVF